MAARSIAGTLQERGVKRGDRVAIYMGNTFPCVASVFGVLMAGGTFLIINPQTRSTKLSYILNDCAPRFLLTDAHLAPIFLPVLPDAACIEGVICSGELPSSDGGYAVPIDALDRVLALSEVKILEGCIALDLAALIYTSGSSGNPKGAMMTHQSMLFTTDSLVEYLRLSEEDCILNVLPLAFDYGLYQLFMAIRIGGTLVLESSFTYPTPVLQRMEEHGVTVFPGVPTIYAMLVSRHSKKELSFPGITRVTNTAAALPGDFIPKLMEIFPNALIFKMYGLTECKRAAYLEPEFLQQKAASVGKAIPGTEAFVLSANGERAKPGEVGILHVRGPHVMLGYWGQPEQSAEMLQEGRLPGERILCTQDYFRTDEDGFLYFVGRSDDIIKTRGEKVSPAEVENALHGIEGIRDAAVVGVPDPMLGEAVRAYVTLESGAPLSEKEIRRQCSARLEAFMVPRDIVFLKELPRTSRGKIRKKELDDFLVE